LTPVAFSFANLEVHAENVYYVSELGILVHNYGGKDAPAHAALNPEEKLAARTMTKAEWKAFNQAERIARNPDSWSTVRRSQWINVGEGELALPSGRFSETNISRMLEGLAPRVLAEVTSNKTGITSIREISLELHHRTLPQRLNTPTANEAWNLEAVYPWSHQDLDPYRHTGYRLDRIVEGPNSF
jgi:hypothetical protein